MAKYSRSTMSALVLLLVLGSACAQTTTIDPEIVKIFGTPAPGEDNHLEQITVRPTEATTTFVDKSGQSCKCVPYYLCDNNKVSQADDPDITGFGNLDIRFGEDTFCQESVEVCCVAPRTEPPARPPPALPRGCGYRNPKGVSVTFTGALKEAQFGEFPWVVALLDVRNMSYAGVGVLIHPQVVLTGAHVAYKYPQGALRARAGEWDTQTIKEFLPFQEQDVIESYIHKDFNNRSLKNDMALLRLAQPFQLAEHINVICLPGQGQQFEDATQCVANGWGKDVFGLQGRYAVIVKKVELDIVPFARCSELMKRTRLGNSFRLHESFICAGGKEGMDTCQGDGGAPLACPIGGDRYQLAGLVSWGIGCGQRDVPGVYTNVPKFRLWVDSKLAEWGYDLSSSVA